MLSVKVTLLGLACALGQLGQDVSFTGPGWYRLTLKGGKELTLKVLSFDGETCDGVFLGVSVQIEANRLESLESFKALYKKDPASLTLRPEKEAKLRDAIEQMALLDSEAARSAYKFVAKQFQKCRPIVHEALRHREKRVRKLAVKLLGEKGDASPLEAAKSVLRDPQTHVRRAAVFAVRYMIQRDEALIETARQILLAHLKWEPEKNNRKVTVKSFERWKDKDAVDPLVEFMQGEKEKDVRNFVANALAYLTKQDFGDNAAAWQKYVLRGQQKALYQRRIK